jgi:GDP-4-dehydro-6-deoxy-D-mannose reductase
MADGERVLLTGGNGFVGRRLHALLRRERPVWEVSAPGGPHDLERGLDVTDPEQVSEAIRAFRPTALVHLAAISAVTTAAKDPRAAWGVNLGGTLNVTEALAGLAPGCRLLYVSSAEVYGRSLGGERPTDEGALLQPVNPYAASKAAADILVRQCAATGQQAVVVRPFNHTGAGQAEVFALPSFAGQIARIEAGLQDPVLLVGDLDDERDFLDVEDVARAYLGLLEAGDRIDSGTVFNVASGAPRRIGDLLEMLLGKARIAIRVEVDPGRVRGTRVRRVVGDASALSRAIQWSPSRDLSDTLDEVLNWSRRGLAS